MSLSRPGRTFKQLVGRASICGSARFTSRAVARSECVPPWRINVTVGHGSWITPFTPILSDVGSQEIWEGAPARLTGRCIELKRTANTCKYAYPIWLLETVNILMQIFVFFWISALPIAVILWFASGFIFTGKR